MEWHLISLSMRSLWKAGVMVIAFFSPTLLGQETEPPSENSSAVLDHVKIGVVVPLTGSLSEFGQAAFKGVQLGLEYAKTHYPEIDGYLTVIKVDNKSSAQISQKAVQQLKKIKKIQFVLGGIHFASTYQIAKKSTDLNIVHLNAASLSSLVQNAPNTINIVSDEETQLGKFSDYLAGRCRQGKIALLLSDRDKKLKAQANTIEKQLIQRRKDVAVFSSLAAYGGNDSLSESPANIHPQILNKQCLIMVNQTKDAKRQIANLRKANYAGKIFGLGHWHDPDFLQDPAVRSDKNVFYYATYQANLKTDMNKWFTEAHQKMFRSSQPNEITAAFFESIVFLAHNYNTIRKIQPKIWLESLAQNEFPGLTGKYFFGNNKKVEKPIVMVRTFHDGPIESPLDGYPEGNSANATRASAEADLDSEPEPKDANEPQQPIQPAKMDTDP